MKGSEQRGSEMIHVKAKLVKYDLMISSMLLVEVLWTFNNLWYNKDILLFG